MSQGAYNVPTGGTISMVAFAALMNAAYDAVASKNSGASTPANGPAGAPLEFQDWFNTTSVNFPTLNFFDGVNWDRVGTLDIANSNWLPKMGGGTATLASAATVNLGASPQTFITITGVASITNFGSSATVGEMKLVFAGGAFTLVHSASIDCPNDANITSGEGDSFLAVYNGSGQWQVVGYNRQSSNFLIANVLDFGADPTGVSDSTTAIQNAINSLPTGGGKVYFPIGTYLISSTIQIGNGSASVQSTRQGVVLEGAAPASALGVKGTQLTWTGAAGGLMILVQGGLSGFGIRNLFLNANGVAGFGLKLLAANDGFVENNTFNACTINSILFQTQLASGTSTPNTERIRFSRNEIFLPNVNNAVGILVDGNGVDATTNTNGIIIESCPVILSNTATGQSGYYFRDCDNIRLFDTIPFGGGAGSVGYIFDYTGHSSGGWPANISIFGFDSPTNGSGPASPYANVGSPGSGARPSRFYAVGDTNTENYPKLSNTTYNPEFVNPGVDITAQVASVGVTAINPISLYVTGMYRISYYLEVTTTGAGGATLTASFGWIDDSGQSQAVTSASIATSAKNFTQATLVFRATTGTNINYQTTVTGTIGAAQYALHVKLEKMD